MQFVIEVVQRGEPVAAKNNRGGQYQKLDLVYKKDGKVEAKALADFANKDIWNDLLALKQGDIRSITTEKNESGFWQWLSITEAGSVVQEPSEKTGGTASRSPQVAPSGTGTTTKTGKVLGSNYETKEERARRQVLIVRQSCLSTAVGFAQARQPKGITSEADDILVIARKFEEFVFAPPKDGGVSTMDDDIPF